MTKRIQKFATCCLIGTLAFAGNPFTAKAEEIPIAGIDVVLGEFYQNVPMSNTYMKDYLIPITSSEYDNLAIAQVTNYVNIRSKANEDSKILGKLYDDSAATILEQKGDWYKVQTGTVTGYIKSEYLVIGDEVEELAKSVGTRIATVNTTTLKVRNKNSLDASVLTLVPIGEELNVKKELDGWVKVSIDSDVIGYVSDEYVDLRTEFKEGESIEEEKARLAEEARLAEVASTSYINSTSYTNSSSSNITTKSQSSTNSSLRQKIVNYALRFQGNPYVWGGTSLTNGADCSGFTQSVFRDNGIYIPRTSRSQASGASRKSIDNIQLGDLIFYGSGGSINHVAIYIGNGKVISASSPETGIRVTNYNYREPYKVVSYID